MGFFTKDEFQKKYKTGKKLGEGSFAEVKLCTLLSDTKVIRAVKIIDKSKCKTEDIEALDVEIAVMNSLDHGNIVKLHEAFHCPKKVYLVMECMSGGELFDRIVEKEKYGEDMARREIKSLAEALLMCHKRDIVHRDLKPENLLYSNDTDDAVIKLADFGLAKIIKGEDMLKTACGTPGYVAPEILNQQPYDEKVDVWSLGVILYIILCGFPPFYHENNSALFKQIKAGAYDFPSPYWDSVSDEAKDLIARMLTVDPTKRPSMQEVLDHTWVGGSGGSDLKGAREELKKFNAKRKFKSAIDTVKVVNALKAMRV